MRIRILLLVAACAALAGCTSDGADCVDLDGDTYGVSCSAGPDCDDNDVNNWNACTTCMDGDSDGAFAGCDQYSTITGPDCNDADVDNQTSCSTCLDGDSDGSFVGCDAYTTRSGPDCNDADADNQTSCSTCLDQDSDSSFVGCDQYIVRSGPDCDDADATSFTGAAPNDSATACMRDADDDDYGDMSAPVGGVAGTDCSDSDPNNFTSCSSCADLDGDLAYSSCDAYVSLPGPDCNESNPNVSPIEPELGDDGLDNDCSGSELVAVHATNGFFVDENDAGCTDGVGGGSRTTPYCSLDVALLAAINGGEVLVAGGTYVLNDVSLLGAGAISVHGGYASGFSSRNPATNTTFVEIGGGTSYPVQYSGAGLILDGLAFTRSSAGGQGLLFMQVADLGAVVNSSFDITAGFAPLVDASGQDANENEGDFVFRGVDIDRASGGSSNRVAFVRAFDRIRIENNDLAITGSGILTGFEIGAIGGSNPPRARDVYLTNNSLYTDAAANLMTAHAERSVNIVGNSVQIGGNSGLGLFFTYADSITLANNALRSSGPMTLSTIGSISVPFPPSVTFANNVVQTASNNQFGAILSSNFGNAFYNTATQMNGCVNCSLATGNLSADIDWVDPANGDFSLNAASVGIDGGADPTVFVPYFRVSEDRDGFSRPVDGDGMNGAQWDVGAIED